MVDRSLRVGRFEVLLERGALRVRSGEVSPRLRAKRAVAVRTSHSDLPVIREA